MNRKQYFKQRQTIEDWILFYAIFSGLLFIIGLSISSYHHNNPGYGPDLQQYAVIENNTNQISVTFQAVAQPSNSTAPAYLLNGYTNAGNWYQIGISNIWGGNFSRFDFFVQFWTAAQLNMIGDPGPLNPYTLVFNLPIMSNDLVNMSMSINGSNITTTMYDKNSSSVAVVYKYPVNGTYFIGKQSNYDGNGAFTGVMTEWYNPLPSNSIIPVNYSLSSQINYVSQDIESNNGINIMQYKYNYSKATFTTLLH